MREALLFPLVVLASCSQSESPCKGASHLVKRCLGAPTFAALQDGDGPWQTPKTDSTGMTDVCVTDDYELVSVYENTQGFYAREEASTWDEAISDTRCTLPSNTTVTLSGQMAQHGSACAGGVCVGMFAAALPWTFTLTMEPGVHDFVATTDIPMGAGGGNVLIRRGQSITSDKQEALVDTDADGTHFDSVTLQVQGAIAGETLTSTVDLITTSGDIAIVSILQNETADLVPGTLLKKGEQQWLELDGAAHGAGTTFTGSESSFTLLPPLTGVTLAPSPAPTVSWTTIPVEGYTDVLLDVTSGSKTCIGCTNEVVDATKGWLDARGLLTLSFDTSAPGFLSRWIIDSSTPFEAGASVAIQSPTSDAWTGVGPISNNFPVTSGLVPPSPRRFAAMTRDRHSAESVLLSRDLLTSSRDRPNAQASAGRNAAPSASARGAGRRPAREPRRRSRSRRRVCVGVRDRASRARSALASR
ncbi:MAG TPA: hypothetical protein VMJ10_34585 [Kofleriaceae bacterium]|nr:hypothetical protein [Kofleriaceae bacterium]